MQTDKSSIDRVATERALRTLEVFRAIDVEMPIGEAASLLLIALGETGDGGGLSVTDLHRKLPAALASASRYSNSLALTKRGKLPGRELVTNSRDPLNDARKILRLAPKGVLVLRQIGQILGDK